MSHTHQVISSLRNIHSDVLEAETSHRGFISTGDLAYLHSYNEAVKRLRKRIAGLRYLVRDNPAQLRRVIELKVLLDKKIAGLEKRIDENKDRPINSRLREEFIKNGKTPIDRVDIAMTSILAEEDSLLNERQSNAARSAKETLLLMILGGVVGFATLGGASWIIVRQEKVRGRIQAEIEDSKNFLDSVIENIPNMLFVKDAKDLRFVRFNKAGEELIGQSREGLLGKSDYDFFPKVEADFFTQKDREVLAGDRLIDIPEEPIQTTSKGERILHTKKIPMRGPDGKPKFLLGISEDITEHKKIEQMKDEVFAMTSHELRTPLMSVHESLEMLVAGEAGKLPDKAKWLMEVALRNSERMIRMINEYLDIEKIESGKMEFKFKPMELMSVIEQAIQDNQAFARRFKVHFALAQRVSGVAVNVDRDRLLQVLTNLLSNAAKFSPIEGVVDVGAARHDKSVRVSVSDHGAGIPEEFRSRIFQKFSQAEQSIEDSRKGTGLGLNIAKVIVERHGGKIGFETKMGAGTTFYFDLPL